MIDLFTSIPLWGLFLLTLLIVLLAFEGGVFLGKKHRLTSTHEDKSPVGSVAGATVGLLAFLLAFTFGIAASKFDQRKELVVEEANAIRTTYLRADYLPDAYQSQIKELLKKYIFTRLEAIKTQKVLEGVQESEALQNQIWQKAVELAKNDPHSESIALFIESLNQMLDWHTKRVHKGLHTRIPSIIWFCLYFVTVLAIGSLGYQFGLAHTRYVGITLLFILTFSTVITMIADLDRPQEGLIQVSQQSLIDLQTRLMRSPNSAN